MKYLVGYDAGPASRRALLMAGEQARQSGALVYIVTSMSGGEKEKLDSIRNAEEELRKAKDLLIKMRVQCETIQLARGLTPGEDLVKFATDNNVDFIFLGIEKKSKTSKLLLGSTAQFIILRGPCPVLTTK